MQKYNFRLYVNGDLPYEITQNGNNSTDALNILTNKITLNSWFPINSDSVINVDQIMKIELLKQDPEGVSNGEA